MNSGVVAVMIKEFLAVLRDSRSRSVLILPPLIQLILFSYAVTLEVKNVSIAIYNQDIGKRGDELIHRVKGSPTFNHVEYLSKECCSSIPCRFFS
jgi:ABC-2 type transport system permease protein